MLLTALCDLYDRLKDDESYEIAPPGYSLQRVTFKVVLHPDGTLFGVQDARIEKQGKRVARQLVVPGGTKPTGAITTKSVHDKVLLLRGDCAFLLGGRVEETESATGAKKGRVLVPACLEFEATKVFHLAHEAAIRDVAYSAVCRFFESWDTDRLPDHHEWADLAGGQGVFQVLGEEELVHERPAVKAWWDSEHRRRSEDGAVVGACLVTGQVGPLARIHATVKGVSGANPTGGAIVGFNEDAYCSYGKEQSFNAPVSTDAAFRYVTALNALLDGPRKEKHRLSLGDATVAFWTDRECLEEDVFLPFMVAGSDVADSAGAQDEGRRKKVEAFLHALRQGREVYAELATMAEETKAFVLVLSPNAARIAVRLFHSATIPDLLANLRKHHEDIRLDPQPAFGKRRTDPEFPSLQLLLDQTCPTKAGKADREKTPPILAGPLLRAVLTGTNYPDALYTAVLRRLRDERGVTYVRAAVLKGYLTRNRNKEVPVTLDIENQDPAYRLGRLFAALEKTQKDALEGINATIRDRYYGAASATPRSVFPRLLRTYQHHLGKLEGGFKVNRERLIQEIVDPLKEIPAHLDLAEQGLFALGYYQQTRAFYTRADASCADAAEGSEE